MTATNPLSVIVGLDGAPASLIALRLALSEAAISGASVEVVHCWHAQGLRDIAFGSTHELHNASICMLDNEVRAALEETVGTVTVTQTSVNGRPAAILLDHAKNADLLVLGAHSHTTLRDAAFGHVAASCRKHSLCPVVIVEVDGSSTRHEARAHAVAAN
jgi:nucleotide-binding universal stress UspA family protein